MGVYTFDPVWIRENSKYIQKKFHPIPNPQSDNDIHIYYENMF